MFINPIPEIACLLVWMNCAVNYVWTVWVAVTLISLPRIVNRDVNYGLCGWLWCAGMSWLWTVVWITDCTGGCDTLQSVGAGSHEAWQGRTWRCHHQHSLRRRYVCFLILTQWNPAKRSVKTIPKHSKGSGLSISFFSLFLIPLPVPPPLPIPRKGL